MLLLIITLWLEHEKIWPPRGLGHRPGAPRRQNKQTQTARDLIWTGSGDDLRRVEQGSARRETCWFTYKSKDAIYGYMGHAR